MNRPVDRDAIKRALGDLPFALSDHDGGGGLTATYTGDYSWEDEVRSTAKQILARAGFDVFVMAWGRLHIASPDVANAPMLAGRP